MKKGARRITRTQLIWRFKRPISPLQKGFLLTNLNNKSHLSCFYLETMKVEMFSNEICGELRASVFIEGETADGWARLDKTVRNLFSPIVLAINIPLTQQKNFEWTLEFRKEKGIPSTVGAIKLAIEVFKALDIDRPICWTDIASPQILQETFFDFGDVGRLLSAGNLLAEKYYRKW